jgi:glycosyltransferase involved in cell wall biosynthesis
MSTVRVAHVVTRLNIGGPARMLGALAPRLRRDGFDQRIVYGTQGQEEGLVPPTGAPALCLTKLQRSIRPALDAQAYWALRRFFQGFRPDVVHTRMAKAGTLGRLAARAANVPAVIHTFHGHVLDGYFPPAAERAILAAERFLARRTDFLVAVSEWVKEQLLGRDIGRPEQWRVIPNGYELAFLAAAKLRPTEARQRLELSLDGPVVGIVGRLVPVKDHQTFLNAASRILQALPSARFVVAGDGPLRPTLEADARRIMGDRIKFLGWVGDLPTLYRSLDVIVLTSRNEGTPAALIEAGASGVPSVAAEVGGVNEVVLDGRTGFLVPPGDAEAAAARVSDLLGHPDLRRQLGEAARTHVLARFDAERAAAAHAALYREVLRETYRKSKRQERRRDVT